MKRVYTKCGGCGWELESAEGCQCCSLYEYYLMWGLRWCTLRIWVTSTIGRWFKTEEVVYDED